MGSIHFAIRKSQGSVQTFAQRSSLERNGEFGLSGSKGGNCARDQEREQTGGTWMHNYLAAVNKRFQVSRCQDPGRLDGNDE